MVERLSLQPLLLHEACKVMSIAPSDFLNITLQYTLPAMCGNCDRTVLDLIAKEIPHFSRVFINFLPAILAHIFLLPTQSATSKALKFVTNFISDNPAESLVRSVVRANIVTVMASLVVKMGDDDMRMTDRVGLNPNLALQMIHVDFFYLKGPHCTSKGSNRTGP